MSSPKTTKLRRLPLALVALVVVLAIVPLLSVVEVPGEARVKKLLGVSERPTAQPCGYVRHVGRFGGQWSKLRPLDNVSDEARAARIGDSIYLVGGLTSLDLDPPPGTVQSVNTFKRYDPNTGRYQKLPPLPVRINHTAAAAYGGEVYVVGGHTDQLGRGQATGDGYRYRPSTGRWEAIDPMPTARGGHGAAVVGDRMYVVGGRHPNGRLGTVEIYNFKTGKWSTGATMPTPRDHAGVESFGGEIYVAGGRQDNKYNLGAFERYDAARDRWARLPDIPLPASSFELIRVANRLVAPGGSDSHAQPAWISGQTWAYEPKRRAWSQLDEMPQPKHGYAAEALGNTIYLFGGSRCGAFRATDTAASIRVPG